MIEKQAELAAQLSQQDKRLAREFIRSGKATAKLPAPASVDAAETGPVDIAKLNTYERYGLTVVPLFLGLLTVIALGLAAHQSEEDSGGTAYEPVTRQPVGFNGGQSARANAQSPDPSKNV